MHKITEKGELVFLRENTFLSSRRNKRQRSMFDQTTGVSRIWRGKRHVWGRIIFFIGIWETASYYLPKNQVRNSIPKRILGDEELDGTVESNKIVEKEKFVLLNKGTYEILIDSWFFFFCLMLMVVGKKQSTEKSNPYNHEYSCNDWWKS